MSFKEWWKTKDYPASCKGNCKEAYEAGLHADVHTDNSAVIAKLEAQIEKMKCLLNEIYSEFGFSELVKIRNDLPLEIQEVIKEIKENE